MDNGVRKVGVLRFIILLPLFLGALIIVVFFSCVGRGGRSTGHTEPDVYAGSESCKECHEEFYRLWSTSHHGKAMQPLDESFTSDKVPEMREWQEVEGGEFRIVKREGKLLYEERTGDSINVYEAVHAMGGKNIFYFLTPLDKGRLQVLPLAYDLNREEWYNTQESAVRHFVEVVEDEALPWKHYLYTFNTTCHSCHVSQLENNYDLESGTYFTTWREPGINCEACHGPSREHVDVFRNAKDGEHPDDWKILLTSKFTTEQHNSTCSSCHAKMSPVTAHYQPGEEFYDHFNLVTLDNIDYYPDGRDLGENYTYTSWSQSPCVQAGAEFHCVTCHTSSGRYRFAEEDHNNACMPCHQSKVENIEAHSYHPADSKAGQCVACHMPKTEFARMVRSDHSMRPPMPAASVEFGSPNACNICHEGRDAAWADRVVRKRYKKDYQASVVYVGKLIKEARDNDFSRVGEMLSYIKENADKEVYTASLIRLVARATDDSKWDVFRDMLSAAESPLVRIAAAEGLASDFSPKSKSVLLRALDDRYMAVRMAAISSLTLYPRSSFSRAELLKLTPCFEDYEELLTARIDEWSAHYNLGNFYTQQERFDEALSAYNISAGLNPEAVPSLVNAGYVYGLVGDYATAEKRLVQALVVAPDNEAANLNYALLLGEQGRMGEAETVYRKLMEINPKSVTAAYNLAVILSKQNIDEALVFSELAARHDSDNSRYSYTYAYFLLQANKGLEAEKVLLQLISDFPDYGDAYALLANYYLESGSVDKAKSVYTKALEEQSIPESVKQAFARSLLQLNGSR